MPIDDVKEKVLPGSSRPDGDETKHQIDLFWTISGPATDIFYIANAKWRTKPTDTVTLPEMMTLTGVVSDLKANVMITTHRVRPQ